MQVIRTGWANIKAVAATYAAIHWKGIIDNLPGSIESALKSPDQLTELQKSLGIADRLITGKPLYFYSTLYGPRILGQAMGAFTKACNEGSPSRALKYLLGDRTSYLLVSQENDNNIKVELHYLIPLDNETKVQVEKLGIHVREPSELSANEILDELRLHTPENILPILADIDELLTGNRLLAYRDESQSSTYRQLDTKGFAALKEQIDDFYPQDSDYIHPYRQISFNLSNESSRSVLIISIEPYGNGDERRTKKEISFELKSWRSSLNKEFDRLKQSGLLQNQVFSINPSQLNDIS
ncbi:MAG: hypothetical protein FD167_5942 [bacterium]|nr:MAG: hypothetical protein FD167_5942 [bacterium]